MNSNLALKSEYTEWTYWVQLDGDFARECDTAEKAEHVRLHEHGHISPEKRSVWRERIEMQEVYPTKKEQRHE
jgi:hypothetical protein